MERAVVISFAKQEVKDVVKAWLVISVAFSLVLAGGFSFSLSFLFVLLTAFVTAGLGFVLHELAHKMVALRFGCNAAFKANTGMLFITLLLSLFGLLFAAPGAVWFTGHVTKKQRGLIAAAGPVTNLLLALLFLLVGLFAPLIGSVGFFINAFLAVFNLLPFPLFDGFKVWRWNKYWYLFFFVTSLVLAVIAQL